MLAKYRKQVNPEIKAVYVTLAPYRITLVEPNDYLSYDIAGVDPGALRMVQMIAQGEV